MSTREETTALLLLQQRHRLGRLEAGRQKPAPEGGQAPAAESLGEGGIRCGAKTGASPAVAYICGLPSPASRQSMLQALDRIAGMFDTDAEGFRWTDLRYEHASAIRSCLVEEGLAPATVNRHLAALRGVIKTAWRMGLMGFEDCQRICALKGVSGSREPAGRSLARLEIDRLIATAGDGPKGARDLAVIGVLYAGLRRAEAASLRFGDWSRERQSLLVHGKGRKERTVFIVGAAAMFMEKWAELRGDSPGPLFLRILRGGRILESGITAQAIYNMIRERGERAGLDGFSPHDLRRTLAGDMLDAGTDLATVQKALGHASPRTTARYDRRPEDARRRAYKRVAL